MDRANIEMILGELFDQVPTMSVREVTLLPADRSGTGNTVARVDIADQRYVLCEITADGRLVSARIIDLAA